MRWATVWQLHLVFSILIKVEVKVDPGSEPLGIALASGV